MIFCLFLAPPARPLLFHWSQTRSTSPNWNILTPTRERARFPLHHRPPATRARSMRSASLRLGEKKSRALWCGADASFATKRICTTPYAVCSAATPLDAACAYGGI